MPSNTISTEEQFQFLISCIRHSREGKVNFDEVAQECEIVSKGAAAKRYERLMKAHGIHPSSPSKAAKAQDTGDSDTAVTPAKRKANSTKAATPKKTPTKKCKKETALASAEKIVEKGAKVKVSITADEEVDEDAPVMDDHDEDELA